MDCSEIARCLPRHGHTAARNEVAAVLPTCHPKCPSYGISFAAALQLAAECNRLYTPVEVLMHFYLDAYFDVRF
jgi:hypothetical protein